MESRRSQFVPAGLSGGGQTLPFFGATLAFWRVPSTKWAAELRAMRDAGLTIVAAHVPWRLADEVVPLVPKFLEAARAAGLKVLLRPGPLVDADMPCFGIPDAVLGAVATKGWMPSFPRAWPVPIYDEDFQAHVRNWFAEIAKLVTDDVVAIGVDHLSELVGREGSIGSIAKLLEEVGLGDLARCHAAVGTSDRRAMSEAIGGPVGISAYHAKDRMLELQRLARVNVAPIRLALDVRCSPIPWLPPIELRHPALDHDPKTQLLALLAGGVRGFVLDGEWDREYVTKLIAALDRIDFTATSRAPSIALVDLGPDRSLANLLGGIVPQVALDTVGLSSTPWHTALCRALELAQIDFDVVGASATEDELASYRAVVVPTSERIDRTLWNRLRALTDGKRATVVIGPASPTHDLDGAVLDPIKRAGRIRAGSLEDLPGLAGDLAGLVEGDDEWIVERPESVRISTHRLDGEVRAVIAINSSAKAAMAVIPAAAKRSVIDAITGERLAASAVAIPPHGARLLAIS